MRADIIKIGNSQGLRLPKAILEQCGFVQSVELRVEGNCLIIEAVSQIRAGWDEAFHGMAAVGDDTPLLNEAEHNGFDQDEWTW
jgi:antitoxin MazE